MNAAQKLGPELKSYRRPTFHTEHWQNISGRDKESHLGGAAFSRCWESNHNHPPLHPTIHPYTWPCPACRCPVQIYLTNTTLSRSATRALGKSSTLFFPDSCFRLKVESKHMWEVRKAPQPPGPSSACVQVEGDQASIWPSWWLRLQFRPYFSKHSDKAFLNLKKDPRPSAKVGLTWVKFVECKNTQGAEQSQMPSGSNTNIKNRKLWG